MDLTKLDLPKLTEDVSSALADGIADLVEGSRSDIRSFASDISRDFLEATLSGNEKVNKALVGQLQLLAEINRIRVENHSWAVVANVTRAVIRAAVAGAVSVLL